MVSFEEIERNSFQWFWSINRVYRIRESGCKFGSEQCENVKNYRKMLEFGSK